MVCIFLKSTNLGSFACIEPESTKGFYYYFMIIGTSILGFQHMWHVVAVDDAFLGKQLWCYIVRCNLFGKEQVDLFV